MYVQKNDPDAMENSILIRFKWIGVPHHLRAILWQIRAGSGGCFMGVSELKDTTYLFRDFREIHQGK